jgi:hypothetical protein
MTPCERRPMPAPRQLSMALDTAKLRNLSPTDRSEAVALLAGLLLEASGAAAPEAGDDRV